MKFSVQLYSLREISENPADFLALFPKLKALGFDGVEFAGYHGLSAEEIRAALDAAGLVATGTHIGLENYQPEKLAETLAFCKTLGLEYAGVGGAPHGSPEEAAATAAVFAAAKEAAAKEGITLYYHNHAGEFKPFEDGTLAIDILKQGSKLELDSYWSFSAGVDNRKFIADNAEYIVHIHIKDGVPGESRALGQGTCDLAAVVDGAKALGLEWLTLEDESTGKGIDSVAASAAWLKANV